LGGPAIIITGWACSFCSTRCVEANFSFGETFPGHPYSVMVQSLAAVGFVPADGHVAGGSLPRAPGSAPALPQKIKLSGQGTRAIGDYGGISVSGGSHFFLACFCLRWNPVLLHKNYRGPSGIINVLPELVAAGISDFLGRGSNCMKRAHGCRRSGDPGHGRKIKPGEVVIVYGGLLSLSWAILWFGIEYGKEKSPRSHIREWGKNSFEFDLEGRRHQIRFSSRIAPHQRYRQWTHGKTSAWHSPRERGEGIRGLRKRKKNAPRAWARDGRPRRIAG